MSSCSNQANNCQSTYESTLPDPHRAAQQQQRAQRLLDLGYKFNKDGRLINVATGEGFVYENEAKYEELGLAVQEYVYGLLENETCLERVQLKRCDGKDSEGFFFMSKDTPSNTKGLIVLISGNGAVRAGLWSRRMAINETLEIGTQIPYIRTAAEEGWAVIVMNINQNTENGQVIEGSSNANEHAETVWRMAVMNSQAKCVGIVAHSYGGRVTAHLLQTFDNDFQRRVAGIALTASDVVLQHTNLITYFYAVARNWIVSSQPVDDVLFPAQHGRCQAVSAGTEVHEKTSWKSMKSVFRFLQLRFIEPAP